MQGAPSQVQYEFKLALHLDESLLEALGATADMPRGQIVDMIKEYLIRRSRDCALCGRHFNRRELMIDHRVPPSDGGGDDIRNLQLLCRKCVTIKGNRSMLEVRKMMRRKRQRDKSGARKN